MKRTARVISVNGKYAEISAERSSMCDGCSKNGCQSCASSKIFGTNKSFVARANNPVDAKVGDTVEIETSDKNVLLYSFLVFIVPIVFCAVTYGISSMFFESERFPLILCGASFVLSFLIIGLIEKFHSKKKPDITITRVI